MTHSEGKLPQRVVALRYEAKSERAPELVAKGNGELAQTILARARAAGIPVHQNPELVALLAAGDLGDPIPQELYEAVARLLTWLWSLAGEPEGVGEHAQLPTQEDSAAGGNAPHEPGAAEPRAKA